MVVNIDDKSFFYQKPAETIVESILELFQKGIKDFESYEMWPYDIPISSKEEDYRYFNWTMNVVRSDVSNFKYSLFGIAGRDYADEPSIGITVVLPRGKHMKKIKIDRSELFDVVAHELHHLAQNMDNNTYMKGSKHHTGKLAYLLDPYEIEAFHIGIRAQSRLSGKSFEAITRDYIQSTWPESTKSQVDRVYAAWRDTSFPAFKQNMEVS